MEILAKIIEKYWTSKTVGFVILPSFVGISSLYLLAAVTPEKYFPYLLAGSIILAIGSNAIWLLTNRIAKHPDQSVGFDLVLAHENEEQGKRIRADFCTRLRDLLLDSGSSSNFSFIEHPQRVCRQFSDESSIAKLSERTKGLFVLYGRTKLRQIDGQQQHVLELSGGVRHAPIQIEISKRIASEMRDAIGAEVIISQENDLFSFKITASRIEIATKYIVSLAALVSGDLDYSEALLRGLEDRLRNCDLSSTSELAKIRNRIPTRLAEIGKIKCQKLGDQRIFGEDQQSLVALDKELSRFRPYIDGWYSGYLLSAICCFELRRDLSGATEWLTRCKIFPDTTWCYSMAFLKAYAGNLQEAWDYYQKAFNKPPSDPSIPNQCESFLHGILSIEPDKIQLWYCLGLINYKAKNDLAGAKRDFSAFLARTVEGNFDPQRKIATRYINKIDRELSNASNVIPFDEIAA